MSLLDRAQRAQSAKPADSEVTVFGLDALRSAVGTLVPYDQLAVMSEENPERARNEIRAACRRLSTQKPWSDMTPADLHDLVDRLIQTVFGLGPLDALISDESISEIMVNGTKSVFIERKGRLQAVPDIAFETHEQVRSLIDRILSPLGRRIDESSPLVSARLPQGHRVHAVLPPLALDGPHLTIRAFTQRVLTLEELQSGESFEAAVAQLLRWAVAARKSLAVIGGTGSGKTTLLNALSIHIPEGERIITIEDAAELKFNEHPHVVRLEARAANAEGLGEVSIRELVVNALRMRPDRIIVGECRADEAIDMLQAMNTGHDGSLTTLHANSPHEAVDRLVTMVRYAVDLPLDAIEAQIGNAFDLFVQTARLPHGKRCVTEIAEVSYDFKQRRCHIRPLYQRLRNQAQGRWHAVPSWVDELAWFGLASEKEVTSWKQQLGICGVPSDVLSA
jgi:pilus assembly protein CpaF